MIERKRVVEKQQKLVVDAVTCDRCGMVLRQGSGFVPMFWPWHGGYLRGLLLPDDGNAAKIRHVEAELCGGCIEDVLDFIGGNPVMGFGPHIGLEHRDTVSNIPGLELGGTPS